MEDDLEFLNPPSMQLGLQATHVSCHVSTVGRYKKFE